MGFSVPEVDITAYVRGGSDEEKAAVAAAIDRACREVGFIQIVGHGIADDVLAAFTGALDAFFGLELEAKKAYRTPPKANPGNAPPKTESLSLSLAVKSAPRMKTFFEAFNTADGPSLNPNLDRPGRTSNEN